MTNLALYPKWGGLATPFRHTWEGIVNIDQFRWLVRRDIQEQLKLACDELGARHVRAVGMFDDEMRVLAKDPKKFAINERNIPRLNWQIVDYVMDSLLDIGVNPMFTTTFMPGTMAAGEKTVFSTKSRISPPNDYVEWAGLVTKAVRHSVERYGFDIVKNWYFEVWNEPNLIDGFWEGAQEDFFKLWQVTYEAIKGIHPDLRIGGPSSARAEWVQDMIEFGRRHDCVPDYMICHIYNNDSESAALSPFDGPQEDKANTSPHFASGVIRGVRTLTDRLGYKGSIHWNEWGRSWWPYFPDRETPNEAAFIAKTMAEVSQLGDYFAFWCLSDIYDQVGYGSETFHGNYGMLNLQGLRKPSYQAFQLLSRLGTERLEIEGCGLNSLTNAVVTRKSDGYGILIYSYSDEEQYIETDINVSVELPGRIDKSNLVLYQVNSHENNIVGRWKELGSPAYLKKDELTVLKQNNALTPSKSEILVTEDEGAIKCNFIIKAPGVSLLEINDIHLEG
jgi:Glycosyl hydrolases family 39.